jgi:hypothetical protein
MRRRRADGLLEHLSNLICGIWHRARSPLGQFRFPHGTSHTFFGLHDKQSIFEPIEK